jgi:hypothetical protein
LEGIGNVLNARSTSRVGWVFWIWRERDCILGIWISSNGQQRCALCLPSLYKYLFFFFWYNCYGLCSQTMEVQLSMDIILAFFGYQNGVNGTTTWLFL